MENLGNAYSRQWYVFYTYPNAEKVVCNELIKREYEVFLPLVERIHQWKNRQRKVVLQVLFPSYIFVKTREPEIFNILQTPKIVRCIKNGDRPAVVSEKDIQCIKAMLELKEEVFVESDFLEGQRVRIIQGPLAGYEGILTKRKGKSRFGVQLDEINQYASIDISLSQVKRM